MNKIPENASIVDVRQPEEFAEGHYPGAVNIPLGEIAQRMDEFKNMQTPIIAYCKSGGRSGMAASMLQQAGISEVHNAGGLSDILNLK